MMGFGKVLRLDLDGDIGIVTYDVPGAPVNTWTVAAMEEFFELVDTLAQDTRLKGVIITSGKPHNFHSGGDLNLLKGFSSRQAVEAWLDRFHQGFNKLEQLKIPSVAAIQGVCLGGGLELALLCTARIAKATRATMLGQPEVLVGLFPGGGGTQRLPRLIGLPALEIILSGKPLSAAKALEAGIVDRVVPEDANLLAEARTFINEIIAGTANIKRREHDFSQIDEAAAAARAKVLKSSRGRPLPAPLTAIKAVQEGVKVSLPEGLEIEKKYFIDVALTPEAKGSMHTFFLKTATDRPMNMVPRDFKARPIKKAAVVGFGIMGRGIVIEILRNMQIPVVVRDLPQALEPGKKFVQRILEGMAEKKKLKTPVDELMQLLTVTPEIGNDFKDADLVIEAIIENPDTKAQVYKELCSVVPADCIICSNTSAIPITRLAESVTHPQRFAGAHFFSPVWLMELLEIVKTEQTSPDTINNLLCFAGAIKKRPIVCRDNPGFVVNAMILPYFLKMYELLGQGVAIEQIDKAMVKFGFPVGPVRLIDEIGIDTHYNAFKALGLEIPAILQRIIDDGRTGFKKSGKGIFLQDGSVDPGVLPLLGWEGTPVDMPIEEIQKFLYSQYVIQGKELVDRKIVDNASLVDVGVIWGLGFPSEKGGPLKWADLTGLSVELFGKNIY